MEESELEKRFIYALERFVHSDNQTDGTHSWKFTRDDSSYSQLYSLVYDDGTHRISYVIIPQYVLNKSKGVEFHTEPDFLIRPVMMQENDGHQWKDVPFNHLRSIAIYMDGYHFHASANHNVFGKDFRKRQSIEASTQYMSFTLSWADMNLFDDQENNNDSVYLRHANSILPKLGPNCWAEQHNSMRRLLFMLGNVWQAKKIKDQMLMYIVGLQPTLLTSYALFSPQPWASLTVNIDMANKQLKPVFNVPQNYQSDEGLPEAEWQDFWRVYDLISVYQGIETEAPSVQSADNYEEIASEFDEELHNIVIQLLQAGIEFNHSAGVVINNATGKKIGEAELVSEKHKFVFFPDDEDAIADAGYTVYEPDNFNINDIK